MKLKAKIKKDAYAALDDALKAFYTESGEDFVLQVEGLSEHPDAAGLKTALDKSREDLRAAEKDARETKAKFSFVPADITAEKFNQLLDSNDGKTVDEKLTAQATRLTNQFNVEKEALTKDVAKYKGMTEKLHTDLALNSSLAELNLMPGVSVAVTALFKDKIKFDLEGDKPVITIDNVDVKTALKNWADSEEGKPFISSDQNNGGDAKGGKGATIPDAKNPWAKDSENLTLQMTISRDDPAKAAKLKAQAGVK